MEFYLSPQVYGSTWMKKNVCNISVQPKAMSTTRFKFLRGEGFLKDICYIETSRFKSNMLFFCSHWFSNFMISDSVVFLRESRCGISYILNHTIMSQKVFVKPTMGTPNILNLYHSASFCSVGYEFWSKGQWFHGVLSLQIPWYGSSIEKDNNTSCGAPCNKILSMWSITKPINLNGFSAGRRLVGWNYF